MQLDINETATVQTVTLTMERAGEDNSVPGVCVTLRGHIQAASLDPLFAPDPKAKGATRDLFVASGHPAYNGIASLQLSERVEHCDITLTDHHKDKPSFTMDGRLQKVKITEFTPDCGYTAQYQVYISDMPEKCLAWLYKNQREPITVGIVGKQVRIEESSQGEQSEAA